MIKIKTKIILFIVIIQVALLADINKNSIDTNLLLWPVESYNITSDFGMRNHPVLKSNKFHSGVDIRAARGTDLKASFSGKIITATKSSSYGYYIDVEREDGLRVRYAHLDKILVSIDDKVTQGQIIGKTGSTGRVTGPHLHMEIIKDNERINPLTLSYYREGDESFALNSFD